MNRVFGFTTYVMNRYVVEGLLPVFSDSVLRVPELVVPSPPTVIVPVTPTFGKIPVLELNALKSIAPVALLEAALVTFR